MVCKEYILLFKLIIYALYLFTRTFSTFYIGLLFTRNVVWRESFIYTSTRAACRALCLLADSSARRVLGA